MRSADRQQIDRWAEHGIPDDLTTREHAAGVLIRLRDENDVLGQALDDVLRDCGCGAKEKAEQMRLEY